MGDMLNFSPVREEDPPQKTSLNFLQDASDCKCDTATLDAGGEHSQNAPSKDRQNRDSCQPYSMKDDELIHILPADEHRTEQSPTMDEKSRLIGDQQQEIMKEWIEPNEIEAAGGNHLDRNRDVRSIHCRAPATDTEELDHRRWNITKNGS